MTVPARPPVVGLIAVGLIAVGLIVVAPVEKQGCRLQDHRPNQRECMS